MASARDLRAQQVIPTFRSASAALGSQLLDGTPLSDREFHSIMNALFGLQASFEVWKKKNGIPDMSTLLRSRRILRRVMKKPRPRPGVSPAI